MVPMHSYFQQLVLAFMAGVVNAEEAVAQLDRAYERVGVVKRTIDAIDEALFLADGVARWGWVDHGTNLNLVVWADDAGVVGPLISDHLWSYSIDEHGGVAWDAEVETSMGYVTVRPVPMTEWDGQEFVDWDRDPIARRIDDEHVAR